MCDTVSRSEKPHPPFSAVLLKQVACAQTKQGEMIFDSRKIFLTSVTIRKVGRRVFLGLCHAGSTYKRSKGGSGEGE